MNKAYMQTTRSLPDCSGEHRSPPHNRSVPCNSSQWGTYTLCDSSADIPSAFPDTKVINTKIRAGLESGRTVS